MASSQASAASSSASSEPATTPHGSANATPLAARSSPATSTPPSTTTSEASPQWSRQSTFSLEEIPALHAPELAPIDARCIPTCPAGSSPWPDDCAHDGWSARMFLHQMLATSHSAWRPSDTESLLSRSTLAISQLRVAGGSSLSDALLPTAPDSPELYLTPAMVMGLLRRALKRKRPLQRVLLRTRCGWRRRTVTCTNRGGGYVFSIPTRRSFSRDSLEAGLLAYLERVAGGWSGTPSTFAAPNGSPDELPSMTRLAFDEGQR